MPRLFMQIEYNGQGFCGWQIQPNQTSVQGEIQKAFSTVLRRDVLPPVAASRTDAGVHARCQYCHIDLEKERLDLSQLQYSINSILRPKIAIKKLFYVPNYFHARYSTHIKTYSYYIYYSPTPPVIDEGKCWHIYTPLNVWKMKKEAESLVGTYDFKSFQGAKCQQKSSVRTILKSVLYYDPPFLIYQVSGRSFLKQMVRNITGTLVDIGRGRIKKNIKEILNSKDRKTAGATAPAKGLFLEEIKYLKILGKMC